MRPLISYHNGQIIYKIKQELDKKNILRTSFSAISDSEEDKIMYLFFFLTNKWVPEIDTYYLSEIFRSKVCVVNLPIIPSLINVTHVDI